MAACSSTRRCRSTSRAASRGAYRDIPVFGRASGAPRLRAFARPAAAATARAGTPPSAPPTARGRSASRGWMHGYRVVWHYPAADETRAFDAHLSGDRRGEGLRRRRRRRLERLGRVSGTSGSTTSTPRSQPPPARRPNRPGCGRARSASTPESVADARRRDRPCPRGRGGRLPRRLRRATRSPRPVAPKVDSGRRPRRDRGARRRRSTTTTARSTSSKNFATDNALLLSLIVAAAALTATAALCPRSPASATPASPSTCRSRPRTCRRRSATRSRTKATTTSGSSSRR